MVLVGCMGGDGAQMRCERRASGVDALVLLASSANGDLAYRLLLEKLIWDLVTSWELEGYRRTAVLGYEERRKQYVLRSALRG